MNYNALMVATHVLGWSNGDTALALGVSESTVRKWRKGEKQMPKALARKLGESLKEMDSDELVDAVRDADELREASLTWLKRACVAAVNSGASVEAVADAARKPREAIHKWASPRKDLSD